MANQHFIKYGKGAHCLITVTDHFSLEIRYVELKKGVYIVGTTKAQLRAPDVVKKGFQPVSEELAADIYKALRSDCQIAAPDDVEYLQFL